MDCLGCSDYTSYKQLHLGVILKTHLRICQAILTRKPEWSRREYHYFDLNAGPGLYLYQDEFIKGSPLLFCEAWRTIAIPCQAHFFEINDSLRTELIWHLRNFMDHHPEMAFSFLGDHRKFLPCYFDEADAQKPRKKFGLVYSDPTGQLPPFNLLARMFKGKSYSTLDVLIYLSATNIKRQLFAYGCKLNQRLEDLLQAIPKKYWIVREPCGRHQWTFLLGTNWTNFPIFETLGFHRIDSAIGKSIITKLNYTNEEMKDGEAITSHHAPAL